MTCEEIRLIPSTVECMTRITRAERACVVKHVIQCDDCKVWLVRSMEKVLAEGGIGPFLKEFQEAGKLSEEDYADSEFREIVLSK